MKIAGETHEVYEQIYNMIERGEFQYEAKINQIKLSQQLGVSRTPVIKALHMLSVEGFLDQKTNSGFYLHKITLKEILDLLLARAALEATAAYDIAENADEETLFQITEAFDSFQLLNWTNTQEEKNRFLELDRRCHKLLLESCNNTYINRMNDVMKVIEHPYALGMMRDVEQVHEEHNQIISAIKVRDAFGAQTATANHILNTRSSLMNTARKIEGMGMDISTLWLQLKTDK